MLKSRKGQEGFTLIELLVVVLIIGILAAIAIPAFLGQKKGAQDANAKSLLRNAAIAMESYYSENQHFGSPATTPTAALLSTGAGSLAEVEPNIVWTTGASASAPDAKGNNVNVMTAAPFDAFILNTKSASGAIFSYVRKSDASVLKCKDARATPSAVSVYTACTQGTW